MRNLLVVAILSLPVLAQGPAATARLSAGCGPDEVSFDVKRDKRHHPIGQPEPGKALVYFFADTEVDHAELRIGAAVTRVGIDGVWMGATNYNSYFFFSVEPGEHRLCTSPQTKLESLRKQQSAAISLTAEAGKVYYFETRTPERPAKNAIVELRPIDPAQAQLLIAATPFSTFRTKK